MSKAKIPMFLSMVLVIIGLFLVLTKYRTTAPTVPTTIPTSSPTLTIVASSTNSPTDTPTLIPSPTFTATPTIPWIQMGARFRLGQNFDQMEIYNVAFSPNRTIMASGSRDGTIILWDMTTGDQLGTIEGDSSSIECLAFSPDGFKLASAAFDGTFSLWQVSTGSMLKTYEGVMIAPLGMAFSAEGTILISYEQNNERIVSGRYSSYEIWLDVNTWQPTYAYGQVHIQYPFAFSPNGKNITFGAGTHIHSTELKALRIISSYGYGKLGGYQLVGHGGIVTHLEYTNDGLMLASTSDDNVTILWDIKTETKIRELNGRWPVSSLAFTPNGEILATGLPDGNIMLWEVATGERLYTLTGHTGEVTNLSFSLDGRTLFSTSTDGTVIAWDILP
jgi:WD40 repeat protein